MFLVAIAVGLLVLTALALIMPHLGGLTSEAVRVVRVHRLQGWHRNIKYFIEETGRLPQSLHALYFSELSYELPLKIGLSEISESDWRLANIDPNYFDALIDYELEVYDDDWVIKEIRTDTVYGKYLSINSSGEIKESESISPLPQEK